MTERTKLTTQDNQNEPGQPQGEWLSLDEAADAMGMSTITLRRYAKKGTLKWRRLGKTRNAKIQVYVTPEVVAQGESERVSTEGLEEVLSGDDTELGEWDVSEAEPGDRVLQDTLRWLQQSVDEKDAKIFELSEKLMAANFRNGYLESEIGTVKDQIKLITQVPDPIDQPDLIDQAETLPDQTPAKTSAWQRFTGWLAGSR